MVLMGVFRCVAVTTLTLSSLVNGKVGFFQYFALRSCIKF